MFFLLHLHNLTGYVAACKTNMQEKNIGMKEEREICVEIYYKHITV